MLEREASVSTYMGNFLAIPHGTNESKEAILTSPLSFVRYGQAIDWHGNPVHFVAGIAGVENQHLEILSNHALVISDEDEVGAMLAATSAEEILDILGEVNS